MVHGDGLHHRQWAMPIENRQDHTGGCDHRVYDSNSHFRSGGHCERARWESVVCGVSGEQDRQNHSERQITEYQVPSTNSQPYGITVGPDGNLWFTEWLTGYIGRITPAGVITEFTCQGWASDGSPCGYAYGINGERWTAMVCAVDRRLLRGNYHLGNDERYLVRGRFKAAADRGRTRRKTVVHDTGFPRCGVHSHDRWNCQRHLFPSFGRAVGYRSGPRQ